MTAASTTQRGFTLIEVVAVILIIGILGVTALSRYIDLKNDAVSASNSAIAATLDASVRAANLRWIMIGSPGRVQDLPGFSDGNVDMSSNGWPIGIDKGNVNDNIGRGNAGCWRLWNNLIAKGPRASSNSSEDYQSYRHSASRSCSYVLRSNGDTAGRTSAQLGIRYNSLDGSTEVCGLQVGNPC